MQSLNPVAMRLEQVKGINNCTIINDSYNSDIHSLAIALDFLNQQNQHAKKTIILSDILESGKDETSLYQEVSSLLENKKINKLIGIGPEIFRNAQFFQCEKYFFQNTADFIEQAEYLKFNDEAILLKGARNFEFERITNILEQKVHRTVLEINLNCMMQNLNYFRSKLKADTKIMVMVKAFSYGSGSFEIANMLEYQKVDYLAVAFTDEGVSLRHAGISLPIVVMNPDEASFRLMIENNLQPEIYNFRVLSKFTEAVKSMLTEAYPVHIKLDTGMNRLGFTENEIVELCKVLKKNKYLLVQSVFSHLAASDEPKHDDFTKLQISRFYKSSNELINALGYPVIRHILNSAGIERFSESQFDMVRLGIGLYGISAIDQQLVKNVSTLKTRVLQIKKVPLNETVGYGRKGRADHEIAIAVIPVGYADGFNRKLGNGVGKIWLNEHYVSVIGNVCMDMTMVNITGVDVHEGDEVEIFGDHISIIEIAKQIDTIPYEVLTSVSNRVKRVYIQE
jgi:alanine racemase